MAEIVLFIHKNFRGSHKHLFASEANLNSSDDSAFNDAVSSFVILSGRWQFFRDSNFGNPASQVMGPGKYPWVENNGTQNDSISSVKLVAE
jgi:hypothetical protein